MRVSDALIKRWRKGRDAAQWSQIAQSVAQLQPDALRSARTEAKSLKPVLDRVIEHADARLSAPRNPASNFAKPVGSDWAWRPSFWRKALNGQGVCPVVAGASLGSDLTVFHDCPLAQIAARQQRNTRPQDLAPFGLTLDVFAFQGGFMSLVIDLPEEAAQSLRPSHILQMDLQLQMERPMGVSARLNVEQGPNTEQFRVDVAQAGTGLCAEFDLTYSDMIEAPVQKAWIDLMIDRPQMNRLRLRDLTLSRRPRAAL